MVRGDADSEPLGLHIMQDFKKCGDMPTAIKNTKKVIDGKYASLNFLATNGEKMYGYRDAKVKKSYFTLYYIKDDDEVALSSRKLTKNKEWNLIKNKELVMVDRNLNIEKIML
jgi:predicted glutamine amidotransferase